MKYKHEEYTMPLPGAAYDLPPRLVIQGISERNFTLVLRTRDEGFYCPSDRVEEGREWVEKACSFYYHKLIDWRHIFGPFFPAIRLVCTGREEWHAYYYNHLWCLEGAGFTWRMHALPELEKKIHAQLVFLGALPAETEKR